MHIVIAGSDLLAFNGRLAKTRRRLEAAGHRVDVVRLHVGANERADDDPGADFQVKHDPALDRPRRAGILGRIDDRQRFRSLLRNACALWASEKPDAFHALDPYALRAMNLWAEQQEVPPALVFDACEWFEGTAASPSRVARYVHKTLSRHGRALSGWVCPSRTLAELYAERYPTWPAPHIFGNVPDWTEPSEGLRASSPLRKTIGAGPKDIVLLFSGALNPKRGIEPLLRGATNLPGAVHLVLLGYGALSGQADKLADSGDTPRLHRLPPVPNSELRHWLAGADAGLIPYEAGPRNHSIATPNKLYEYPGAGVPVIATALPLVTEAVEKADIGRIMDWQGWGQEGLNGKANFGELADMARALQADPLLENRLARFFAEAQSELLPGLETLYDGLVRDTA